jgi:DNA polymerase I-like protein with 3'-5' exonuclease and polymerase domains
MLMSESLIVLRQPTEIAILKEYLADKDLISFDTETTGVQIGCQLIGASFCASAHEAFYVVVAEWDKTSELKVNEAAIAALKEVIESLQGKSIIMHNAIFDARVIYDTFRIRIIDSVFADTMIMAHLVNEEGPKKLKDLGTLYFGNTATKEQMEMKASVLANGGVWQDGVFSEKEMYKADAELIGKYGAKDALLTFNLFYVLYERLEKDNLLDFCFTEESMPLLRGPTYDLNTVGLKVDLKELKRLELEMEHEIERLKNSLNHDISGYVADRENFSITAPQQLSWLLFIKLGYKFRSLTDAGRIAAKELLGKIPYSDADKRKFISAVNQERKRLESNLALIETKHNVQIKENKAAVARLKRAMKKDPASTEECTTIVVQLTEENKNLEAPIKKLHSQINKLQPEKFLQADKAVLKDLSSRVEWIAKLLKLKSEEKLLGTYIKGIQSRVHYGVIYPRFNQVGTPSGRYSSSDPNFQNLPRKDKRVKSCIVSRPGKSFVGADYDQLEPRVFSSISQDERLLECFRTGLDFYSVVGSATFGTEQESLVKDAPESFSALYPDKRDVAKQIALASPYGTTANKQAQVLRNEDGSPMNTEQCQEIIDTYFEQFPGVQKMMLDSHAEVKNNGVVYSLFGRPRRLPLGISIGKMFPNIDHAELAYEHRTILNLGMNFKCQSAAASIVNRAAIEFKRRVKDIAELDPKWIEVKIVLQVHDSLIIECPDELAEDGAILLKDCMENTSKLNGVALTTTPKIGKNLADV